MGITRISTKIMQRAIAGFARIAYVPQAAPQACFRHTHFAGPKKESRPDFRGAYKLSS